MNDTPVKKISSRPDPNILKSFLDSSSNEALELGINDDDNDLDAELKSCVIHSHYLEYKEEEDINKYAVLLRSRSDILCQKFLDKTRAQMRSEDKNLTDMINVNLEVTKSPDTQDEKQKIGSLDDYIASLNINEQVL